MKVGDKGENVRELQKLLQNLGFAPGEPDADFGDITKQAVMRFQRANGMQADGEVTEQVMTAIRNSTGRSPVTVSPSADILQEVTGRVPRSLRDAGFSIQRRTVADYFERARAEPQVGFSERVARTAELFLELGVHETRGQNRGPWVDFLRAVGGGVLDKPDPWCAFFVSACWRISNWVHNASVPVQISGSAAMLWIDAPEQARITRDAVPNVDPRGAVFVRTRSGDPIGNRDVVLSGRRTNGHTGIVVGRLADSTLLCIAGNSSGEGHSRQAGSGGVAMEQIGPATPAGVKAFDRLVGLVDYRNLG